MSSFGIFLKQQRLEAGIGMSRFARLVGIKPSKLNSVEHGRSLMSEDILELVADLLGLEDGNMYRKRFLYLGRQQSFGDGARNE